MTDITDIGEKRLDTDPVYFAVEFWIDPFTGNFEVSVPDHPEVSMTQISHCLVATAEHITSVVNG